MGVRVFELGGNHELPWEADGYESDCPDPYLNPTDSITPGPYDDAAVDLDDALPEDLEGYLLASPHRVKGPVVRDMPIDTPSDIPRETVLRETRAPSALDVHTMQAKVGGSLDNREQRRPQMVRKPDPAGPRSGPSEPKPSRAPAILTVTSPAGGTVGISGLLSPVKTLRASRCNEVIVGNNCQVDHREVHRLDVVDVDLSSALKHPGVLVELRKLVSQPQNRAADANLCQVLRQLAADQTTGAPDRLDVPLAPSTFVTVERAQAVQIGDQNKLTATIPIERWRTTLPAAALLAESRNLRALLVEAIHEGIQGPAMTAFLRGCLAEAGCMDDLEMLNRIDDPAMQATTLRALFGRVTAADAAVVMVGSGNDLTSVVTVDHGEITGQDIIAAVEALHELLAPAASVQADRWPMQRRRAPAPPAAHGAVNAPTSVNDHTTGLGGNREGSCSHLVDRFGMPCRASRSDGFPCPARDTGLCG